MKLVVEGVMEGNLPWTLVFIGVFIAIVVELLGIPVMPFAVGMYLPVQTSSAIMIGGCVRLIVDKMKGVTEKQRAGMVNSALLSLHVGTHRRRRDTRYPARGICDYTVRSRNARRCDRSFGILRPGLDRFGYRMCASYLEHLLLCEEGQERQSRFWRTEGRNRRLIMSETGAIRSLLFYKKFILYNSSAASEYTVGECKK